MLAVPYTVGSATPSQIALAAEARGHTVTFLIDPSDPQATAHRRLLKAFGPVVEVRDPAQAPSALSADPPAGVVTFSESTMLLAAAIADAYGLAGHDPDIVSLLGDKAEQRKRLNAEGVGSVATVEVRGGATAKDMSEAPLPGVLKPKQGAGSRDTVFVASLDDLFGELARHPSDAVFVVEERLLGLPGVIHPELAPYLSVESAVAEGKIVHLGLTGRLPLSAPARERGLIYPVPADDALREELLDLTMGAIKALGIRHGITHTEIMVTPHGPQIIEVNARLGGGLASIIPAASGLDMVGLSIDLALGVEPPAPPSPSRVAAHLYVQPPMEAASLKTAPDVKAIRSLDGVYGVDRRSLPGQPIDWRSGSAARILDVWIRAEDLENLISNIEAVESTIALTTEWTFK